MTMTRRDNYLQEIIKLQLRKPRNWNWELSTSKSSPHIALPIIQLYDAKGNLLIQTKDCVGTQRQSWHSLGVKSKEEAINAKRESVGRRLQRCRSDTVDHNSGGLSKTESIAKTNRNESNNKLIKSSSTLLDNARSKKLADVADNRKARYQDEKAISGTGLEKRKTVRIRKSRSDVLAFRDNTSSSSSENLKANPIQKNRSMGEVIRARAEMRRHKRSRSDDLFRRKLKYNEESMKRAESDGYKNFIMANGENDKSAPRKPQRMKMTAENVLLSNNASNIEVKHFKHNRYTTRTSSAGTLIIREESFNPQRRRRSTPDDVADVMTEELGKFRGGPHVNMQENARQPPQNTKQQSKRQHSKHSRQGSDPTGTVFEPRYFTTKDRNRYDVGGMDRLGYVRSKSADKCSVKPLNRSLSNSRSALFLFRELSNEQDEEKCDDGNYIVQEPITPSESRKSSMPVSELDSISERNEDVNTIKAAYIYLIKPLSYWKQFNVAQTKPWPIFGDNLPGLLGRESVSHLVQRIYNVADNVRYTGFFQMTEPVLCIKDPELIKEIMIKDFDHFVDHKPVVDPTADPLWGNNLFALTGQKWRDMRLTLTPAFTSAKMKHMFGLMTQVAENFTTYFSDQDKDVFDVELKDTLSRFTNDVIATTAFGVEVNSITNKENDFYNLGKEATNLGSLIDNLKFLIFLMCPFIGKHLSIKFFTTRVANFFRGLMQDTIQTREKQHIIRPDLVNLLMEANKEKEAPGKNKLTLDEISAQALVFFFAGFESVSGTMCFACYEMGINQEIQDKLREEINKTLKENNGKITYDSIQNMKYMDMVVSETLRKWPSFASNDRICTKPYTFIPINPGEKPLNLKINDHILFPTFAIQRDPKYFPNPEKFDPERFSDENKNYIVPYTYIPFGGGPRNCIGSRFALLETKILLFYLLRQFRVVPNAKTEIPVTIHPRAISNTAKDGFHFNLEKIYF